MSHRPKSVREIYAGSVHVNLDTLARQLVERGITVSQVDEITQEISNIYNDELEKIAKESEVDMMAIENAPSPLELFISCISKYCASNDHLPVLANSLLNEYVKTMQEWM